MKHYELLEAAGGLKVPQGAAAGLVATSDASGNVTWGSVTKASGPIPYGTLAQRNALNLAQLPDGWPFFATDDNGGTLYQAQASAWVRIGPKKALLDYAERPSDLTGITSTSYGDIASLAALSFTAPDVPVRVRFYCPAATNNVAGHNVNVRITSNDAGPSTVYVEGIHTSSVSLAADPFPVERILTTLTPGTNYQFKAQVKISNAGDSGKLFGSAPNGPICLYAEAL